MAYAATSVLKALPPAVIAVVRALAAAENQVYVVGGAVRDALLGLECNDVDLECYGTSYGRLAEVVAPLGRVNLVGRQFGILKLAMDDGQTYDISLPRRENKQASGTGASTSPWTPL